MKHHLIALLLLLAACTRAYSQQITGEDVFLIKDYSVFEYGYPLMVAPGGGDEFIYIEYWPENIAGRQEQNYYLQKYRITDYSEIWFKPLTYIGYDQIPKVTHLFKLDKRYVVVGHQYSAKEKRTIMVARFWEMDGKSPDLDITILSKFGKNAPKKDLKEDIYISPTEKCMMWFASNGEKNYASAWSNTGENLWAQEISFPMNDKYKIKDVAIDDKGNPTFLLTSSKLSYTVKDTAQPMMLMYFNTKTGKATYEKIKLDSAQYFVNGLLKLISPDEIVVAGIASHFDPKGNPKPTNAIKNGIRQGNTNEYWSHLYCGKFKITGDSIGLVKDSISVLPESWVTKYKDGCSFSDFSLVYDPGVVTKGIEPSATLVFEEVYTDNDKIFYGDVGYFSFKLNHTGLNFGGFIPKKQRDNIRGNYVEYLSYSLGKTKGKIHFVYLTEAGAAGKLVCQSIDLKTGIKSEKFLANNDQSMNYFFPARSKMVSANQMILVGVGNPSQNNYKLMTITF